MELLMVILIITILAGMALAAMHGATEVAREQRTRAIISKLDQLIMEKWEEYRTRPVPIKVPATLGPPLGTPTKLPTAAYVRLCALRELMRMEMPDRISDLCNPTEFADQDTDQVLNAVTVPFDIVRTRYSTLNGTYPPVNILSSIPSVALSYKRKARNAIANSGGGWSRAFESSECLYLIISSMRDGDKSALDFFFPNEIGDVDEDGMNEILDAWGTPILFIRWPAGYVEQPGLDGTYGTVDDLAPQTLQTRDYKKAPDTFDPFRSDPRWSVAGLISYPYAIYPLILSAGRDKSYDIDVGRFDYIATATLGTTPPIPPNDPYYSSTPGGLPIAGNIGDADGDGTYQGYADNITNHFQQTP